MTFLRADKADYFQELMAEHEDYWAFQFSDPMLAMDYAFFLETTLGYHQELRRQRHLAQLDPSAFAFDDETLPWERCISPMAIIPLVTVVEKVDEIEAERRALLLQGP